MNVNTGNPLPIRGRRNLTSEAEVYTNVETDHGNVRLRLTPRSEFEMDVVVRDVDGNDVHGYIENHGSHVAATLGGGSREAGEIQINFSDSPLFASQSRGVPSGNATLKSVSNSWGAPSPSALFIDTGICYDDARGTKIAATIVGAGNVKDEGPKWEIKYSTPDPALVEGALSYDRLDADRGHSRPVAIIDTGIIYR